MATKTAYLKLIEGLSFVGKADSNRWISMDADSSVGGSDSAIRPKELILLGLIGCSSVDIVSILRKKKANLKNFEVNLKAETREEHPQIYTKIEIEYVGYGDINPSDFERAIQLSEEKYCSVNAMLRATVAISSKFTIINE